ncbi:Beta-nerve growth factor [Galemys pyrenaicus]|uniref:Beta-nerve growth factor n=1 Tax=Galemys pyrenaicus TaxID=202257 RepID=A0A8J6A9N4_GALPY|nr:Beta-nerve growth factor [Galemys pyrenaicus]
MGAGGERSGESGCPELSPERGAVRPRARSGALGLRGGARGAAVAREPDIRAPPAEVPPREERPERVRAPRRAASLGEPRSRRRRSCGARDGPESGARVCAAGRHRGARGERGRRQGDGAQVSESDPARERGCAGWSAVGGAAVRGAAGCTARAGVRAPSGKCPAVSRSQIPDPGSRIPDPGSRIPDPRSRIPYSPLPAKAQRVTHTETVLPGHKERCMAITTALWQNPSANLSLIPSSAGHCLACSELVSCLSSQATVDACQQWGCISGETGSTRVCFAAVWPRSQSSAATGRASELCLHCLSIPGEEPSEKEQIILCGQTPKYVGDKHSGFVSLNDTRPSKVESSSFSLSECLQYRCSGGKVALEQGSGWFWVDSLLLPRALALGRAVQGTRWHAGPKLSSASGPNNGFSKGAAFCPGHIEVRAYGTPVPEAPGELPGQLEGLQLGGRELEGSRKRLFPSSWQSGGRVPSRSSPPRDRQPAGVSAASGVAATVALRAPVGVTSGRRADALLVWGSRREGLPGGLPPPATDLLCLPQVLSVMSVLFYTLITALLIGTQAEPRAERHVPAGRAGPRAHWTKLQLSLDSALRRVRSAPARPIAARVVGQAGNVTVDPQLFQKRRLRSPRVLFSTQPPPLAADAQDLDFEAGDAAAFNRTHRSRRSAPSHPIFHRGEFSVCDSVSVWVGDKTTATDIKGKEVMVLGEVNINSSVFKQYFFETKCRDPNPVDSGCRGIDAKHWNSYCTTTHTFVKALTMEGKQAAWRFIRIDTACVCVLSRKAGRRP